MATICRMAASSPVIAALEKAEAAELRAATLFQVEGPGTAALRAASREDPLDPIAVTATELLLVRKKLNRLVNERMNWSQKEASRLGNEFLTELFGQTVPGPVTLPLDGPARH